MRHIKTFTGLGMNINSDQYILPDQYTAVPQPYYKGAGNHSIQQLEQLCEQFTEYCHQQAIIKQELIKEIRSL